MKLPFLRGARWAAIAVLASVASAAPPTPAEFSGFPIGAEGRLVRWERIVEYFEILDRESDRVVVERLGRSTNGNPFILAIISSPANLARLDEIRRDQYDFAHPTSAVAEDVDERARRSPAVAMVTGNIHATEIGASQMALEQAHRMAIEDSPRMRNVLENVVFLLVPSANPDGQIMVVDWNDRVRDTQSAWAPLPWLYHPYVGHDNNRDAFMMTQVESRHLNKALFQDWFPQVYVDEHQQGPHGMRVFVPPFANPINPNVDPAVWAWAGEFGMAMYRRLHEAGVRGVGYGERYTAWWQGGFLRGAWFHNMVGILTETASANLAGSTIQERAEVGKPPASPKSLADWIEERERNPDAPLPPPDDVMPRFNYPRPWLGGRWSLRDVIDAELAVTDALLEHAADNRVRLIETQIRLGREAVAEGERGDPWAYVFPADARDRDALYALLEALRFAGVEVDRARAAFRAGGDDYPAGSYVIRMAQPFRAYAKDLLEAQRHPDPEAMPAGAMADQPYDLTAWSLPLQMGVRAVAVEDRFDADLERLEAIPRPRGRISQESGAAGFLIAGGSARVATAAARLRDSNVALLTAPWDADFPAGSLWVEGLEMSRLTALAEELGLDVRGLERAPEAARAARPVRTALYRPWTASIDEGWTRWLLEEYEIPFSPVFNDDLRGGDLRGRFDVLLFPGDRDDADLIKGNWRESTPEEFRGGIGEAGRDAVREFVSQGGTLAVWGDAVEFALKTFEAPLRNALADVPRSKFSCPGALLRLQVDNRHPAAFGMPATATALFKNDAAFEALPEFSYTKLRVIARYPPADLLQSGWIRGEEHLANRIAAAEFRYRRGRVIVIGFRPQFRAQSRNTFKMLFNAILGAGLEAEEAR